MTGTTFWYTNASAMVGSVSGTASQWLLSRLLGSTLPAAAPKSTCTAGRRPEQLTITAQRHQAPASKGDVWHSKMLLKQCQSR